MTHHLLDTVAGRLLYGLIVVALVVIALVRRETRRSLLVRAGAALLGLSLALVMLAPSLLAFALFFLVAPIGVVLMMVGTILSFVTPGRRVRRDVEAFVAAARRSNRVWPDHPPMSALDRVVEHGPAAGSALAARLQFDSIERLRDETWSTTLEQQLGLALCRIYGETPAGARTVYDVRAMADENTKVKAFWDARVRARPQVGR